MPVYQSPTKTSIFDDFSFSRSFGDFSFSGLKSADFTGLECHVVLYNSAEWISLYKIQSADTQKYISFILSGIEANMCRKRKAIDTKPLKEPMKQWNITGFHMMKRDGEHTEEKKLLSFRRCSNFHSMISRLVQYNNIKNSVWL